MPRVDDKLVNVRPRSVDRCGCVGANTSHLLVRRKVGVESDVRDGDHGDGIVAGGIHHQRAVAGHARRAVVLVEDAVTHDHGTARLDGDSAAC